MTAFVQKVFLGLSVGLLVLGIGSCRGSADVQSELTATPEETANAVPSTVVESPGQGTLIQQWASGAEASSEFADPEWSAERAVGPPDAPGCGDYQFAWASAASDAVATLTLTYSIPVFITEIHVVESFNPDQVVKVEALTPGGDFRPLYRSEPRQVDRPCPYQLTIPVEGADFKSDVIRITVDQSVLGLGWNEIDAVQLTGVTER